MFPPLVSVVGATDYLFLLVRTSLLLLLGGVLFTNRGKWLGHRCGNPAPALPPDDSFRRVSPR